MFSLQTFLDGMSKPLLRDMHAKAYGQKGLLNNSLILSETATFFLEKKRFAAFVNSLEQWQKDCISLIYLSGSRGLELNELRLAVSSDYRQALESFLLDAAKDLYLWRSKNDRGSFIYQGFEEFMESLVKSSVASPMPTNLRYVSNSGMLDWHICEVLSFAQLGKMRMNGTGNLHRRSLQIAEEAITYSRPVSTEASHDEVILIMQFLSEKGWLVHQNNLLQASPTGIAFLKRSGFRLRHEFLHWWVGERFHGDMEHFKQLLCAMETPQDIVAIARLFWILDPSCRLPDNERPLTWTSLAKPLRELWIMGFIDFAVDRNNISFVKMSDWAHQWISSQMDPLQGAQISTLPNFEMIISVESAPRVLFMTSCLATVQNDEPYLRFIIKRDAYLEGLKSGFDESEIADFSHWISAPTNVSGAMAEWATCYFGAKFKTGRLLKIENKEIQYALFKFPQFMEMVEESIPGYGFVIKQEKEASIREILKHYGLEPALDSSLEPAVTLHNTDWNKEFWLPWPTITEPDYTFKPELDNDMFSQAMGATKYSGDYQRLEMYDLFKVLRYARSTGTLLGARIRNPEEKTSVTEEFQFTVQTLYLSKNPFHAEVLLNPQQKVFDLPLTHIEKIRLLHGDFASKN